MAKVTGPIFSVEAHGALGDGICFTRSMGGARVILNPTHKDAYSALQSVQRSSFITGKSLWRALSAASKAYYNGLAEGLSMTGYNFYLKKVLLGQIGGVVWVNDSFSGIVAASADDAAAYWSIGSSAWALSLTSGDTVGWPGDVSKQWGFGNRVLNVGIPAKATILTAHVHLTPGGDGTATVKGKIVGNIDSDPAVFSTIADYKARRGTSCGGADNSRRTVKEVDWDFPASEVLNAEIESPDISEIIQELVDGAGYVAGRAMVLFVDDHDLQTAINNSYGHFSYNQSTTKCAKLHVTYKYAT